MELHPSQPRHIPRKPQPTGRSGGIPKIKERDLEKNFILPVANGGTGSSTGLPVSALADGTDGELITWDSSGVPATVAVGTATHVLTSNGAGAAPTFQAPSGGAWTLIESQTASASASLDFTTGIDSTYDHYVFILTSVLPATDGRELFMRCDTNGGASFDSGSVYSHAVNTTTFTTDTNITASASTAVGNAATEGVSGMIKMMDPSGASTTTNFILETIFRNTSGTLIKGDTYGSYLQNVACDAVQFLFSSGNIASGTIALYGINKS